MIMARSSLVLPSGTSSRYMNMVTNGAWPLQVISVISWYWIVWIPLLISSFRRRSVTLSMICLIQCFSAFLSLLDDHIAQLLAADIDKRRQMGQGKALSAVLIAGHLRDDLRRDVAGSKEAVRLFNHGLADDSTVLQHILQVDQVAVMFLLGEIIRVVEVDDPFFMRSYNFFRKEDPPGQVLAHFAGHVVSLGRVDDRVFVGILLLDLLIELIDQSQDSIVRRIGLPGQFPLITVADVFLRHFVARASP